MVFAKDIVQSDFPVIKEDAPLSTLLGLISKNHVHWAVVVDKKGKYLGMTDKKKLLHARVDVEKTKVKNCVVGVPKVRLTDDSRELILKFLTSDVKALPVFHDSKLVGVVRVSDVIAAVKGVLKGIKAADVMPKQCLVLAENETCGKAMNIMTQKKLHHIPVVNAAKKLIGIVSLVDMLEKQVLFPKTRMHISRAASHQQHRQTGYGVGEKTSGLFLPVGNILSRDCCSCSPEESMVNVVQKMLKEGHSTAIIVKDNVPVGMVTVKDILVQLKKIL